MSIEKNMNTRIQHKHDIEANWNKALNFIPKIGEIIVYDIDENYNYSRFKIGDGVRTINNLEFSSSNLSEELLNKDGIIKQEVLPAGYPYVGKGIIVEETIAIDEESGQGIIINEFQLVKDEPYIITWNGVEYNCISKTYILESIETIALGNIAALSENEEPTDEPFIILAVPESLVSISGGYGAVMSLDGSTEVIISISGNIIQKISKDLLPSIGLNNVMDGDAGSIKSLLASNRLGMGAVSFGHLTTALGDFSHAEGYSDSEIPDDIHLESTLEEILTEKNKNNFTLASGHASHAEGFSTLAYGQCSHAEGYNTITSGSNSHAEGSDTIASGDNSHAEGSNTIASGWSAHAEGAGTTASGDWSHVQGKYNIPDTNDRYAHIVGNGSDSMTRSNAHTLDWNGKAWFAGNVYVGGEDIDSGSKLATESTVDEKISDAADSFKDIMGNYYTKEETAQFVEILSEEIDRAVNQATQEQLNELSDSINNKLDKKPGECVAGKVYKIDDTDVIADNYAEIFNIQINRAIGSCSHAEGYNTTAYGGSSHAEGYKTTASGEQSHAEGMYTIASGNSSHAEGYQTIASGYTSHAEGVCTTASGDNSHAEGSNTIASGNNSHAEGFQTTASNSYSHTEGYSNYNAFDFITEESAEEEIIAAWNSNKFTLASGHASHAEGFSTLALGNRSHAEGFSTLASGEESHAEGMYTIASGNSSHAEGSSTTASGNNSHAEGYYTEAFGDYSHVQGKYNINNHISYAHIVGNGTANNARSNAHTLDWNGNAWFAGDIYVGSTSGTNRDEGSKKLATEEYVNIRVPAWTDADEGKFLRIVNGTPTWVSIPDAKAGEY